MQYARYALAQKKGFGTLGLAAVGPTVHADDKADFAPADTHVACGCAGVSTDVVEQLTRKSLAKAWQKRMTSSGLLPFGSKSQPPLPPPVGKMVNVVSKV